MDVLLYQTADGGEIDAENGQLTLTGGLPTAVYLSLFGGNEEDNGLEGNPREWWGNLSETDPARRYRCETGHLLQAIPAVPANLRRIEDAAGRDLAWLTGAGVASEVSVSASIPGLNRVGLAVTVRAEGQESRFNFVEAWKVQS